MFGVTCGYEIKNGKLGRALLDTTVSGVAFDMLKTVLDDIPDTCLTEYFPAAADIVRNQMAYDLVIGGKDPEAIAKDCAEELRSMIF